MQMIKRVHVKEREWLSVGQGWHHHQRALEKTMYWVKLGTLCEIQTCQRALAGDQGIFCEQGAAQHLPLQVVLLLPRRRASEAENTRAKMS